jgi:N-carbamoylputrescine amidase
VTASRTLTLAAIQMACGDDSAANVAKAEAFVRRAAGLGARLILLPELFETPYFCKDQSPDYFALAHPLDGHATIARMAGLAAELGVVLPVSFFEKAGQAYFNSVALIDADGTIRGHYRKSHIPDGPGYQEKFYFSPGDTGFKPVSTRVGSVGTAICWDQWFPETARVLALEGAELLLYPTAIGNEPQDPAYDSRDHWRRVMQGHAAANLMPLVAANRVGTEQGRSCAITFYGSSFIAGPQGELVAEAGRDEETVLLASFDLDQVARMRMGWGVFRDRRPELYRPILTLDGKSG